MPSLEAVALIVDVPTVGRDAGLNSVRHAVDESVDLLLRNGRPYLLCSSEQTFLGGRTRVYRGQTTLEKVPNVLNGVQTRRRRRVSQEAHAQLLSLAPGRLGRVHLSIVFHNPRCAVTAPVAPHQLPAAQELLLSDLGAIDEGIDALALGSGLRGVKPDELRPASMPDRSPDHNGSAARPERVLDVSECQLCSGEATYRSSVRSEPTGRVT